MHSSAAYDLGATTPARTSPNNVIPDRAAAGAQDQGIHAGSARSSTAAWIPACAGMTAASWETELRLRVQDEHS